MKKIQYLCAALTLSLSTFSMAALEQVTYTDTNGNSIITPGLDFNSANFESNVVLFVSGGLDRKIQATFSLNGLVVSKATSTVININDRFMAQGREFYGKEVNMATPLNDGVYTLKLEYSNLIGEVTSTDTYTFTLDTQKPTINGNFSLVRNAYYGTIDHFGTSSTTKQLRVSDVDDSNGVGKVIYWTKHPDGTRREGKAEYNSETKTVVIPAGVAASKALSPTPAFYEIGIDVFDTFGNKASHSRHSHVDLTCPSNTNTIKQVYDDSIGSWVNYTRGMEIHSNPVKVRYRRLLSDFASNTNPYGWKENHMVTNSGPTFIDYERTFVYPQAYTYFHFFSQSGHSCATYRLRDFNFKLGPNVDSAPKFSSVWYKTTLSDEWQKTSKFRTNVKSTLHTIRTFVEPRGYRQKVSIGSIGSCLLEPNESSCDIDANVIRDSGFGYVPYPIYVSKEDDTWKVHSSYVYTYWDFNKANINEIDYNESKKEIVMKTYDADNVSDWRSGIWTISSVAAKANVNGSEITLPFSVKHIDFQNRTYTFDVSGISAEQEVPVTFTVTDSFGNILTKTNSYKFDTVAPMISTSYEGKPVTDLISEIRDLRFNLSDGSPSTLTSVQLTGSNSNEDVFLSIIKIDESTYSVDKPKIFPTLDHISGEKYSLHLTARDSYSNESLQTISFGYLPENLIVMSAFQTLESNQPLYLKNGEPIAKISTKYPLELDSGQLATGVQLGEMTNRSNSSFAIGVKGGVEEVFIMPGETKPLSIDLGETGAPLDLTVYPEDALEGNADFMLYIPTLTSIY